MSYQGIHAILRVFWGLVISGNLVDSSVKLKVNLHTLDYSNLTNIPFPM